MEGGELKLKSDFITNSSSASYILTLKTKKDTTFAEFKEMFNDYLEKYKNWNGVDIRYWEGSDIIQIGENTFTVSDWTSMHNGSESIPSWMTNLMLDHFIKDYNFDWTVEAFKVEEDG